jgi:hypothetical protein
VFIFIISLCDALMIDPKRLASLHAQALGVTLSMSSSPMKGLYINIGTLAMVATDNVSHFIHPAMDQLNSLSRLE